MSVSALAGCSAMSVVSGLLSRVRSDLANYISGDFAHETPPCVFMKGPLCATPGRQRGSVSSEQNRPNDTS